MARPHKIDDYVVHRIAELFRYADAESDEFVFQRGDVIMLAEQRLLITSNKCIPHAIGELLCDLEPKQRPRILYQVADVLRRKPRKLPDNLAVIREAYR